LSPNYDPTGLSVKNGPKENGVLLATKKDLMWITTALTDDKGRIGEDLKRLSIPSPFCGAGKSR
jgi:hypothetical protein